MGADLGPSPARHLAKPPLIVIPEVRDYQRINSELVVRLDEGHSLVRLTGADGHRLLVSGISGNWNAVVEVEGRVGPEIGFGLNAPGLTVICRGDAADGAGSGLQAGLLVILGSAGHAVGYAQRGGTIVVTKDCGHRAGLNQSGGLLVLLGSAGRLVGERQSQGTILVGTDKLGPHSGHGHHGGRLLTVPNLDEKGIPENTEFVALFERLRELELWPPQSRLAAASLSP